MLKIVEILKKRAYDHLSRTDLCAHAQFHAIHTITTCHYLAFTATHRYAVYIMHSHNGVSFEHHMLVLLAELLSATNVGAAHSSYIDNNIGDC